MSDLYKLSYFVINESTGQQNINFTFIRADDDNYESKALEYLSQLNIEGKKNNYKFNMAAVEKY